MKLLAVGIGILGKFLLELKWWYKVQWFKNPHNEEEILLSRHLVTSLGTVSKKSWDSAVLGHYSLGTVLGRCSLGTVLGQSSFGTILGQYSLVTVRSWDSAVLGQRSHGTVQSWDTGFGTVVLGQWSWDSGLGTVVLGQWSWDSGLGTVVLGH